MPKAAIPVGAERIQAALEVALATLVAIRDENGDNKHFPARCMTALNKAIDIADPYSDPEQTLRRLETLAKWRKERELERIVQSAANRHARGET